MSEDNTNKFNPAFTILAFNEETGDVDFEVNDDFLLGVRAVLKIDHEPTPEEVKTVFMQVLTKIHEQKVSYEKQQETGEILIDNFFTPKAI